MIGRTNVGGSGGGGTAFAYIRVTYPSGGVVRCSDGRKNYVAKDTSGIYVFGVPYAATWTLTLTADGGTATTTVSITSMYQVANASLTIWDGVVFDITNGPHAGVTGVWSGNSSITAGPAVVTSGTFVQPQESGNRYLQVTANGASNGGAYFVMPSKKVDISAFSTMSYTVRRISDYHCESILYLSDSNTGGISARAGGWNARNNDEFATITTDISSLSGSYYIILGVLTTSTVEGSIRVSDIRFGN